MIKVNDCDEFWRDIRRYGELIFRRDLESYTTVFVYMYENRKFEAVMHKGELISLVEITAILKFKED